MKQLITCYFILFLLLTSCLQSKVSYFMRDAEYVSATDDGMYYHYHLKLKDTTFIFEYGTGLGSFLCKGQWKIKNDSIILITDEEYLPRLLTVRERKVNNDTLQVKVIESDNIQSLASIQIYSLDTILFTQSITNEVVIKRPVDSIKVTVFTSENREYVYIPKNSSSNFYEFVVTGKASCPSCYELIKLKIENKKDLLMDIEEGVLMKKIPEPEP